MPTNDPDLKRLKAERSNRRIAAMGYTYPHVSISKRNYETPEALAFFRETRQNVSDITCVSIIKEWKLQKAQSSNNNMMYYMDEHQRRLLTLPRISEYLKYEQEGNKSVVKLFEEGAITQSDLYEIWCCANRIRAQIEKNPKAKDAVNSLLLEELKHGTKG